MNVKVSVFLICVEAIIYFYYIICVSVPLKFSEYFRQYIRKNNFFRRCIEVTATLLHGRFTDVFKTLKIGRLQDDANPTFLRRR